MLVTIAVAGVMAGCAYVDALDSRSETLNRSMTDYRNAATLLNIVRASNSEPMDFVALTGATGHSTFNGSQGLPTFIIGPHTAGTATNPVVARNYVFGPNSIQESAGTDFNVSLLDDPQSYAALMTPIDPSMLAFLQRQNIDPGVLLPLVISEIRIIADGNVYEFQTDQKPDREQFFSCDRPARDIGITQAHCVAHKWGDPRRPDNPDELAERKRECRERQADCVVPAALVLAYLKARSISFQVPVGSAPGAQQATPPPARICFDTVTGGTTETFGKWLSEIFSLRAPPDLDQYADFSDTTSYKPPKRNYQCDGNTPWIKPVMSQGTNTSRQSNSGAAVPGTVQSICRDGACAASKIQNATPKKSASEVPMYEFYDGHETIQIFTRSTWGIYQFLGDLIYREDIAGMYRVLYAGRHGDFALFTVIKDGGTDCFTSVTYSGVKYCIPNDAYNSKMILSVLHQLQNLYTKPNTAQQPNTGTTRITQ
jgi:hypothetical protein